MEPTLWDPPILLLSSLGYSHPSVTPPDLGSGTHFLCSVMSLGEVSTLRENHKAFLGLAKMVTLSEEVHVTEVLPGSLWVLKQNMPDP